MWRFIPEGSGVEAGTVSVPSQWTHGTAWGYPEEWSDIGAATLSRSVELPPVADGESLWLHFEAVMLRCVVSVDGREVGRHDGGFTPFEMDVTAWAGRSVTLDVFVRGAVSAYSEGGLEWPISYPKDKEEGPLPAGIWQPVWLIVRPVVFLRGHAIDASVAAARIRTTLTLANGGGEDRSVRVRLLAADSESADFVLLDESVTLPARGGATLEAQSPLGDLPLWSPASPRLLEAVVHVTEGVGGDVVLAEPVRFGLREFGIEGGDFFLNGVKTHLVGDSLVRHRISPHLWRRDYLGMLFREYRALGINCLRTHGSIVPGVVLDVADEVGMLIQNQSALWSDAIFSYYEAGERFLTNAKAEFTAWFRRDRNHPSVVLWDVENEQIRIVPKCRPMIEELVRHLRDLGATVPVVASGCSAADVGDAYHEHCGPLPRNIIRRWKAQGRRKPFIHGEWWADQTLGLSQCLLFCGMAGSLRLPQQAFGGPDALRRAYAFLYARQFVSDRLEGVSGTTAFSFEQLLFEPLLAPGGRIDVPVSAEDPVGFPFPDHADRDGLHLIRRPLVNPGWSGSAPTVRRNPIFEDALRAAFAPFLVGFLEFGPHPDGEGAFRRTLVALNDHPEPVSGTLEVFAGDRPVAAVAIDLDAGGRAEHPLDFRLDADESGPVTVTARWTLGAIGSGETVIGRFHPPGPTPAGQAESRGVHVSGLAGETLGWLRAAGWEAGDAEAAAPTEGVWLMAGPEDADPEAVDAFLRGGGVVIALGAKRQPPWLPPVVEHHASLAPLQPTHVGWGFDDPGRDLHGILQAPVHHRDHPVFDGLALNETPWCPQGAIGEWNAGDERVADDTFRTAHASRPEGSGHVDALAGGPHQRDLTLAEITLDHGRILLCQFHIEANLGKTAQADRLLGNLLRYACGRSGARPGARCVVTGDVPDGFPDVGAHRVDSPDGADAWIHFTADADALTPEQRSWVGEGGTLVRLPSGPGGFERGTIPVGGGTPLILTPGNTGERLSAGAHNLLLEMALPDGEGRPLLPRPDGDTGVVSVVPAWSVPAESPVAGTDARGPVADFWQRMAIGRGEAHTIAAGFGGDEALRTAFCERLLRKLGVPVPFPDIAAPEIPVYTIQRCEDPPPADAFAEWTGDGPDADAGPWSRARRVDMVVAVDPGFPEIRDIAARRRCAAYAQALYDDGAIHIRIVGVAPAISPLPPGAFIWFHSAVSITFGFNTLLFCRDAGGELRHVLTGTVNAEAEPDLRLAVHDFERVPGHPAFAGLDLAEPESLRAQIFQASLPWALLGQSPPTPGRETTLQFRYLVAGSPDARKAGDLVAPAQTHPDGTRYHATFAASPPDPSEAE